MPLTKTYRKGEHEISPLIEADLTIERGEFISLMGASGSGKSTLLNVLAGIDRPTAGHVIVGGVDVHQLSRITAGRVAAANVGYIFQTHNLIPVLTAYENVELPLLLLPFSRRDRRERVEIALEAVGLTDRAHHYPRQLSGGQEQRVGIARSDRRQPDDRRRR